MAHRLIKTFIYQKHLFIYAYLTSNAIAIWTPHIYISTATSDQVTLHTQYVPDAIPDEHERCLHLSSTSQRRFYFHLCFQASPYQ